MPRKHIVTKVPRILLEKNDETEYALITKALGAGKFLIKLNMSATEMIGRLCGKMKRGKNRENKVEIGSVVLVGLRDFQDNIVDIIHVYNIPEVRQLQKNGNIVFDVYKEEGDNNNNDDIIFDENFNFDEI